MTNFGDGSTYGGDVSVVITIIVIILILLSGTRAIIVFSRQSLRNILFFFFLPNTNMISPLCPTTMIVDTFSPTLYIFPVYIIISLFAHHVYFLPNGFVDALQQYILNTSISTHRAPR